MASKAIYATGRRKTSTARVYLKTAKEEGQIVVNSREFTEYFPRDITRVIIQQPLEAAQRLLAYDIVITVQGGGVSGQAGAVRHGIARALIKAEPELRPVLKKGGFLTRDSRAVERKKAGLHKARKRPQFSKR